MAFPRERWSLSLGTWFGIPIALHFTFFLLLAGQIVLASAQHHVSLYTWSTFLLFGPIFFVSILTHGLSHAFRIKHLGGQCQSLLLWPLGSLSTYQPANNNDRSVLEDLWMALLGISTFVPNIALWITVVSTVAPNGPEYLISKPPDIDTLGDVEQVRDWISALARRAIVLNLVLLLCNASIPAYPLDASLGWSSILVYMGKETTAAASIVGVGGVVVGVGLIVYTQSSWSI
jgi:Zn-dependent protease